jgi:hypothetical protein
MSEPTLDDFAANLATKLLKSNKNNHEFVAGVTENGRSTGEKVVVISLVLKNPSDVEAIKKVATRMATLPSGSPCPCCSGSGRK